MDRTRSVHDLNRSIATALVWSGGVDRGGFVVLCACIRMVCVCGDVFLENVTIPIPERVGYVLVCGVGIRTSIEHNGTGAQ